MWTGLNHGTPPGRPLLAKVDVNFAGAPPLSSGKVAVLFALFSFQFLGTFLRFDTLLNEESFQSTARVLSRLRSPVPLPVGGLRSVGRGSTSFDTKLALCEWCCTFLFPPQFVFSFFVFSRPSQPTKDRSHDVLSLSRRRRAFLLRRYGFFSRTLSFPLPQFPHSIHSSDHPVPSQSRSVVPFSFDMVWTRPLAQFSSTDFDWPFPGLVVLPRVLIELPTDLLLFAKSVLGSSRSS